MRVDVFQKGNILDASCITKIEIKDFEDELPTKGKRVEGKHLELVGVASTKEEATKILKEKGVDSEVDFFEIEIKGSFFEADKKIYIAFAKGGNPQVALEKASRDTIRKMQELKFASDRKTASK